MSVVSESSESYEKFADVIPEEVALAKAQKEKQIEDYQRVHANQIPNLNSMNTKGFTKPTGDNTIGKEFEAWKAVRNARRNDNSKKTRTVRRKMKRAYEDLEDLVDEHDLTFTQTKKLFRMFRQEHEDYSE